MDKNADMDSTAWDDRYADSELVWSIEPNRWVVEFCADLPPGRALDVAAGEGRNAIWLAEQGWTVTAVDFSAVAVQRMTRLAAERLGDRVTALSAVLGDATKPQPAGQDLVLFSYLHLPEPQLRDALAAGVAACTPGGRVLVIGHARRNIADGIGGPQDPDILYDPDDLTALLAPLPVDIERAELGRREVETEAGVREALDTVVVARKH